MKYDHVIVCGLPSSGNRVIQRLLEAFGFTTRVEHFGRPAGIKIEDEMRERGRTAAVYPVRSIVYRRLSQLRVKGPDYDKVNDPFHDEDLLKYNVLDFATAYVIPLKVLSYEGFVEHPVAHMWDLLKWLGAEASWSAVEKAVSDEGIYNANEGHRPADVKRVTEDWRA